MATKKKVTVVKAEEPEAEVPYPEFDAKQFAALMEENKKLKAELEQVQKAGEPVPEPQVEVVEATEHPDIVLGDSKFRWIGHMEHKRIRRIFEQQRIHGELKDVEVGEEEEITKYPGSCLACGMPLYIIVEGSNTGAIGDQLAVFVVGAQGERPATYCQAHDPTRKLRREGLKPGTPIPGELFQIQKNPVPM